MIVWLEQVNKKVALKGWSPELCSSKTSDYLLPEIVLVAYRKENILSYKSV